MKLDNETKKWLDDLARQGWNQRDAATQLMYRVDNANINTPGYTPLTYEHAVNLYKSARKRVRKSDTNRSWAAAPLKLATDAAIKTQAYVDGLSSVTSEPNNEPAGILIPVEADDLCIPQVSLEGPEQAPEAAIPSQATPSPSAASPEPPAKDPPAPFHELFPGLTPSAAPPLSKYVSEAIANNKQEIGTNNYSNMVKSDPITRDTLQTPQVKSYRGALGDYIESVAAGGERNPVIEESYADDAGLVDRLASLLGPEFKKKWDNGTVDHDQIVSLLFKLEPGHPTELIDRLVSLLGSETRNKWDNGALTHDQIVSLFKDALDADFGWEDAAKELGQRLGWRWDFAGTLEKRALFEEMCDKVAAKIARQLGEDDLEKAFWDFDTSRKRGSERDAFKMVVRAALSQRELFNSESKPANGDSIVGRDGKLTTDPNNDRYDRIYEAQLGMYNGIRDLTDAVRALPISSVIAAKDETIAAKDAELETLREYVRHLQRQVGAS